MTKRSAEIREAVRDEAKVLDNKLPNWYKKIDIKILDMEYPELCILGQIFGVYERGRFLFGWDEESVPDAFAFSDDKENPLYNKLWSLEVLARQVE